MKLSYDAQKEHRWRFRFVERRILLLNGDIFAEALALKRRLHSTLPRFNCLRKRSRKTGSIQRNCSGKRK